MSILTGIEWPFICAACFMFVAGVLQISHSIVPNSLSLGGFLAALPMCLFTGEPIMALGSVFVCAAVGFGLLIIPYAKGFLGAGCVKMQAAFGAWVGLGMSLRSESGVSITFQSSLVGIALTVVGVAILYRLQRGTANVEFTFEEPSHDANPQGSLFPAQATLSAGSIGFLLFGLIGT